MAIGRRWEPQRIRAGNGSKNVFSCKCSRCEWVGTFDSYPNLPDEMVSKKFQHFGWLLGRTNAHNICKKCLNGQAGVQAKNELANVFRVIENGSPVQPSRELRAEAASEIIKEDEASEAKIDDILARHFGPKPLPKSEAPMVAPSGGGQTYIPMGLNLEQTLDLIHALQGLNENIKLVASELGNVRAALELQAEQTSELVRTSSNQVKALTMIGPLIAKTTEAVTSGFSELKIASPPTPEPIPAVQAEAPEPPAEEAPALQSNNITVLKTALKQRRAKSDGKVSIYSSPAKTGPQAGRKWYTTIRISRELWNAAKLSTDRVVVSHDGDSIKVSTPSEEGHGVKVSTISDVAAILKVSNLGDINSKEIKTSIGNGSLNFSIA